MAFLESITNQESYRQYLREAGIAPSKTLERCFACGLPAVWLYNKAIGLEDLYFELIKKAKDRAILYKEIFYLLTFTNSHNKFFPSLPKGLLKLKIPPLIAAAQVEIAKPAFEMTFDFTKEQLKETLRLLTKPNVMIHLGNQRKAIGMMYADNAYHIYHSDNPHALEFKDIEGCVQLIMRVINEKS